MAIILAGDLAKYGYKPDIMYKSLIELLYFVATLLETKHKKICCDFFLLFSLPFDD